jgi:hypothetical protein
MMRLIGIRSRPSSTYSSTQRAPVRYLHLRRHCVRRPHCLRHTAHQRESDTGEIAGKKAILGALALNLDFTNLFMILLQLFGQRRDN